MDDTNTVTKLPFNHLSTKRPRPIMRAVPLESEDLAWDPIALEQFVNVEGEQVRAGDSFAICRPGMERWPLGHVSDVYKSTSHRGTVAMIMEGSADAVEPFKSALLAGIGSRVVHQFHVKGVEECDLHGLPVTSRLTVVHDHTGLSALQARMVVYVGKDCLGSIVGARAIHVASNPEKWRTEIDSMVVRSQATQESLTEALRAADTHLLTEGDKALLESLKVNPPAGAWGATLLDSLVQYFKGKNSEMTFGVWERRLSDAAIQAMCRVLPQKHGRALDTALGGKRYSGKTQAQWAQYDLDHAMSA